MADPLGCVAVTETGLKLALAVGKLIQALHDAPDELLALSNELCDLRLTVERVRQATSNTAHPSELPGIGPLLFQARIRFEEAERILTRLGQLGPYGTVWNLNTWERILWQKEKKKVVVLQKQLRAIRSNVSLILGTHSSLNTNKIAIDVQELLLQTAQIHSSHTGSLEKHRECLEDLTRRVPPSMQDISNTQKETNALLDALLQAVPKLSLRDPSTDQKLPQKEIHQEINRIPDPKKAQKANNAKSPSLSYYFPHWFVQRAITISMTTTAFGTPNLNIKVRRVVSEMSDLFRLSRFGDVEGCQTLFSKQQASPDDVNPIGGWTALHFAVDHGSVELSRLLIQEGADPNWEDSSGMTAIEIARRNVLQPRVAPRAAEIYAVLISRADRLQERYFSRLHEVILELTSGDIEEEIKSNPPSLEAVDIYGWTPLHWAVRRNDTRAVDILLRNGANPFAETGDDQASPIHLAARADSASCVELLLQARYKGKAVEINGWDKRGRTPLRIAAGNDCVACTALLIQKGAEIDNQDRQNETALLSAVYESAHETIPLLIKAGANTKAMTRSGNTVLHFAANESDLKTLTLLSRARMHGVDVDAKNYDGLTARELAVNRIGAPYGFIDAFDRLIASIVDTYWVSPVQSPSIMSDQESFKSFEDEVWNEVEEEAEEEIREALRVATEYRDSQAASPQSPQSPAFFSPTMPEDMRTAEETFLLRGIHGQDMVPE